jgi:tetratricopeptide (TPR) repeat protein
MSSEESSRAIDLKQVTGLLADVLKLLGGALGVSSLGVTTIYAIGFVVTNTSLLRHGAYELSLLRTEFLAAGISYSVLTLGMIFVGAVVVDRIADRMEPLLRREGTKQFIGRLKVSERAISLVVIFLSAAVLLLIVSLVAGLFSAGVRWWHEFGRAVTWAYVVALFGGLYVKYLQGKKFWQEPAPPARAVREIGKAILGGIPLLLLALLSYGMFAYPLLPKSWGGGSPIYVEFVVKEEAIAMLEVLGLGVGEDGLTERVTFLTESPERLFVVTQQGDTLSFDPALVKASKFYDVNYYASAEARLDRGDWYREQGQWNDAIREYRAALLIQTDLLDAWTGRGMAYTEKFLKSCQKESRDQQAYDSADRDLSKAIMLADEVGDHHTFALALYQRGRLRFHHGEHMDEAPADIENAIKADSSFLTVALLEEAFRERILDPDDEVFRKALHVEGVGLAGECARLGRELKEGDEPTQAATLYGMAACIAEDIEKDTRLAAQYRALGGDALETVSLEYAIKEYEEAVELDPEVTHYCYRLALLSYQHGDLEEAYQRCDKLIDEAGEQVDVAATGCLIVRGNVRRDREEWDGASKDYDDAIEQAIELGVPSYAASAYCGWARLHARRENTEDAISLLEKAIWLDRAHREWAEVESDFDILRELSDYQRALSPPVVVDIESDTEAAIVSFILQEPADDFPERLTVLTQILDLPALVKTDGTGQADFTGVLEEGLVHSFHLREDADYSAGELASALRNLLGLAD